MELGVLGRNIRSRRPYCKEGLGFKAFLSYRVCGLTESSLTIVQFRPLPTQNSERSGS